MFIVIFRDDIKLQIYAIIQTMGFDFIPLCFHNIIETIRQYYDKNFILFICAIGNIILSKESFVNVREDIT
jgi:hypothetical protein